MKSIMNASCIEISLSEPGTRVATPTVTEDAALSCCQQAVMDALDSTSSMGVIVSLVLLVMGFAMGVLATAVAVHFT